MLTNFKIGIINLKFIKQIYDIERESFKAPYPQDYLEKLAKICPKTFLVASVNGYPVGYVVAYVEGKIAHIISLAINPKWRRKGIGERLMLGMTECVRKSGVVEIRLEVREANTEALKLYEKLGYRIFNKIDNYYDDGESAIVLFRRFS